MFVRRTPYITLLKNALGYKFGWNEFHPYNI